MKNRLSNAHNDNDLQQVVEPLASYICATERPRKSLKLALAALLLQIDQTNRTAAVQAATFRTGRIAASA